MATLTLGRANEVSTGGVEDVVAFLGGVEDIVAG